MKVFILAAGQGSRLAPLTHDKPKSLVELNGESLLSRQQRALSKAGLRDITIVAGYKAELISALGYVVKLNPRFAVTNMVATFFSARDLLSHHEDLLICYGDIVYEPRLVKAMLDCNAAVCVAVDIDWQRYWAARMPDPLTDAETMKLSKSGHILELGKKPTSLSDIQGQYVGLIKVRANLIAELIKTYDAMDRAKDYDGKNFDNMFMTSFIQYLIDAGWHVQSVPVQNGWLEVDTISDLELYERMYRTGNLSEFYDGDF